jgi:hypothetical protein
MSGETRHVSRGWDEETSLRQLRITIINWWHFTSPQQPRSAGRCDAGGCAGNCVPGFFGEYCDRSLRSMQSAAGLHYLYDRLFWRQLRSIVRQLRQWRRCGVRSRHGLQSVYRRLLFADV